MHVGLVRDSESVRFHADGEELRRDLCEQGVPVRKFLCAELPNPRFPRAVRRNGHSYGQPAALAPMAHELSTNRINVILTN